jgi:4-diphosphocytidyl-2-C-methyl-D-erythritol kinase
MSSRGVEASAPGKINLILRVLDRRPDQYHNLWSVMQAVELADTVWVEEAPASSGISLSCEGADLPAGSENLVYRAAQTVLDRLKCSRGLRIRLLKRLPIAAGIGGGSSDAAATIQALALLLQTGWSQVQMAEIGEEIGSDVPFFLYGPTALVQGRGERVTPIRVEGERWLVLVNPGIAIPTVWAYGKLAESRRGADSEWRSAVPIAFSADSPLQWNQLLSLMENDFRSVMEEAYPSLRDLRVLLLAHGAQAAMLSGSGSTVFGVFQSEEPARRAADRLERQPGCRVWVTRTRMEQELPRPFN